MTVEKISKSDNYSIEPSESSNLVLKRIQEAIERLERKGFRSMDIGMILAELQTIEALSEHQQKQITSVLKRIMNNQKQMKADALKNSLWCHFTWENIKKGELNWVGGAKVVTALVQGCGPIAAIPLELSSTYPSITKIYNLLGINGFCPRTTAETYLGLDPADHQGTNTSTIIQFFSTTSQVPGSLAELLGMRKQSMQEGYRFEKDSLEQYTRSLDSDLEKEGHKADQSMSKRQETLEKMHRLWMDLFRS